MKSEAQVLEEILAENLKTILELEAHIGQMSANRPGSLGMGLEAYANAQVQLQRVRAEQSALEQRYKALQPANETVVGQGTKDEILTVLEKMGSDNGTFKLIKVEGNPQIYTSPKES